jgi:hypothetical protein
LFYFVRQDLFNSRNIIEVVGHTAVTGEFQWISGVRFDRPVPNEVLELDPSYGTEFPDLFDTTIPLMSGRLLKTLRDSGADNLDAYPMTLRRIDTGETFDGYSAVNVIGCVDAIALNDSEYLMRRGRPYFTGKIAIDEAKVKGLEIFRLPRGPGFIVGNERISRILQQNDFKAMLLQPTTDYAGA